MNADEIAARPPFGDVERELLGLGSHPDFTAYHRAGYEAGDPSDVRLVLFTLALARRRATAEQAAEKHAVTFGGFGGLGIRGGFR